MFKCTRAFSIKVGQKIPDYDKSTGQWINVRVTVTSMTVNEDCTMITFVLSSGVVMNVPRMNLIPFY